MLNVRIFPDSILLTMLLVACGSKQEPEAAHAESIEEVGAQEVEEVGDEKKEPPDMVKKPDHPVQKVVSGGIDETGAYVSETRKDFERCLTDVFMEVALKASKGEKNIVTSLVEKGEECRDAYFQTMKGGINIHPEDIEEALQKEEERQKKFYKALKKLVKEFKKEGVKIKVMPPDQIYSDPSWDTAIVAGCNIKIEKNAYFYAFPPVPAMTRSYMALTQGPVAASAVLVREDFILLFPASDLSDSAQKACKKVFGKEESLKDDFPEAEKAVKINNLLILHSKETYSFSDLEEFRKKYNVLAVLVGKVSEFTAYIYTGQEEQLPSLLKNIFSWHEL